MEDLHTAAQVIALWGAKVIANPKVRNGLGATFKIVVEGPSGGRWVLNPALAAVQEGDFPADCTLMLSEEDLVALARGELNPQIAYLSGRLKLFGEISLALRLGALLD